MLQRVISNKRTLVVSPKVCGDLLARFVASSFVYALFFANNVLGSDSALSVTKHEIGIANWPLSVDEGTISCEWKVLIPNSNYRHAKRPLVIFESQRGKFGINGAAKGVGGYKSIAEITIPERRNTGDTYTIVNSWLRAGLALCDGDLVRAQLALDTATNNAAESSRPHEATKTQPSRAESIDERRVYKEAIACWDVAVKQSFVGFDAEFDRLVNSGRRNEAAKLSQQRLEKEDALNKECRANLRRNENLSHDQLREIEWRGFRQKWPDK